MVMLNAISEINQARQDLKREAAALVDEVRQLLRSLKIQQRDREDAQETKGRPLWVYLRERPGYGTISIVWTQVVYFNKQKNLPHYRDIARGRGYQISQRRFLKYARGYHPQVQAELWEFERAFGGIRQRQVLLNRARTCLFQYHKKIMGE